MSAQSLGFFDSGVGGLTIWQQVKTLLPVENTIYLADSSNAPYGNRTKKEIQALCQKNVDLLLQKKCKLIVVACNTATTQAIKYLRASYQVPFIGIEPAIKPAALHTKTKVIGVLATRGTLVSGLFAQTAAQFTTGIKIIEQVGDGLVEQIEKGAHNSNKTRQLLEKYLKPMIENKADYLVLGCTHYAWLVPVLKKMLPPNVVILDTAIPVARQLKKRLHELDLNNSNSKKGTARFYTNANPEIMARFLSLNNKQQASFLNF